MMKIVTKSVLISYSISMWVVLFLSYDCGLQDLLLGPLNNFAMVKLYQELQISYE